jgi:hypothetical protein
MGMRNLDRIPIREWRSKVETVAYMLRERRGVVSKCQACGLIMQRRASRHGWSRGKRTNMPPP